MDKYYQKRSILSLFLAFIILITALPTAYAEENGGETKSQVEILSPIAINEIVPDTDNHGKLDGYEFFELQNVSDTKLNLDDFIIRYNISDIWELDDKGLVLEPEDILVIWIKNTDNQDLTIDDFNNYYNTKLEQAKNLTTIQSPGFHNSKQRDLSILTKT